MFYIIDLLNFQISYRIKIIILTIILIILLAFLWLFGGKIPIVVHGKGLFLLQDEYILSIVANTKGVLKELKVLPGSEVKSGEIIAKIHNPTLLEKLLQQKYLVQTLVKYKTEIDTLLSEFSKVHETNFIINQTILKDNIYLLETSKKKLENQYKNSINLFEKKIISQIVLDEVKHLLNKTHIDLNNSRNELIQLESNKYSQLEDLKDKQKQLSLQIAEANKELELFNSEIVNLSNITATTDGIVLEYKVPLGMWVSEGTPITSLLVRNRSEVKEDKDKYLLAYFPAKLGKLIKVNMLVKVTPTVISKEEYGSIMGLVDMVSPFPISKEAMFSTLHNGSLVEEFYNGEPLIFVRIRLKHNQKDYNGFFWTSDQGPNFKIEGGTIADAIIILEYKKPINLIMQR